MKDNNGNWMEPSEGTDMSNDAGRLFKKDPAINVISKEEFEERIEKVFHLLWKTLSKSFGPYGAPTLIYNYPYHHVTKDGYTIMKSLSMDASETKVDQAISDMASDICGRLNYSVGDGTTSAVIATNSIYQNYRNLREELEKLFVLPRDVIKKYTEIKDEIIEGLQKKVVPIRTEDLDQLWRNIYDVVYISSNGDELITGYIADLYRELGAPAISCVLAPDGITKKVLIDGYKYDLTVMDKLYFNNDNKTCDLHNADVVIFSTKITADVYSKILVPLNRESRMRGRKLIVAAPFYDEDALRQLIVPELNHEYDKAHSVNMILTNYRAISSHTRKLVEDFAVLMNTRVIDRSTQSAILDQLSANVNITQIFNIDDRDINGLRCIALSADGTPALYSKNIDVLPEGCSPLQNVIPLTDTHIDLGYVGDCSLGLKTSTFTNMVYDEERYKVIYADAKDELETTEAKYKKLGTFNVDVSQCQNRLYALNLRMGIIEVGGDSELSQKLLKDAVDDSVKAANSAFNHGVVLGCNTNLIQVIHELYVHATEDTKDEKVRKILLQILLEGFLDVYRTVLRNAFKNEVYQLDNVPGSDVPCYTGVYDSVKNFIDNRLNNCDDLFNAEPELFEKIVNKVYNMYGHVSIHDVLIYYSLATGQVLDVSKFEYSTSVINSCQTDEEILTATIDLITLLIVGNQMVITQKHNFED